MRIEAELSTYVQDRHGERIMRSGEADELVDLCEYWPLARRGDRWMVVSIEQKSEGDHQLDAKIVAAPWSDDRLRDESLTELAVADKVPEGFTTADLVEVSSRTLMSCKSRPRSRSRSRSTVAATSRTAIRPRCCLGSRDRGQTFVEQWTLALDGPDESPWRLLETSVAT